MRPDEEAACHTAAVALRVHQDYPPDLQEIVLYYLGTECGRNLPFQQDYTALQLERVQLRVLEVAHGDLALLQTLVEMAKRDWRDVLQPTRAEMNRQTAG